MSVQVSGNFLPGMESRLLIIGHEALPGDALISPPACAKEPFFSLFVIPTLLLECNSCKPRPGFSARGRPVTHFHTIASPGQPPSRKLPSTYLASDRQSAKIRKVSGNRAARKPKPPGNALHRDFRSVKLGEGEARKLLIVGGSLIPQDADRDSFPERERVRVIRAPVHGSMVAADTDVGRDLVHLAADRDLAGI